MLVPMCEKERDQFDWQSRAHVQFEGLAVNRADVNRKHRDTEPHSDVCVTLQTKTTLRTEHEKETLERELGEKGTCQCSVNSLNKESLEPCWEDVHFISLSVDPDFPNLYSYWCTMLWRPWLWL